MKRIVLSLGGSVLVPSLESHNISAYAAVIQELGKRYQIFIVVGGGGEARRYIGVARSLGIDEAASDELGIAVTRINASLLAGALGDAVFPGVATSYQEAKMWGETGKIVVMGGITPAQTTDAVSAVLAEYVGAEVLINATSIDGIYSNDPKKHPDARRFERITPAELVEIVIRDRLDAGSNAVVDLVAAKVVQRSRIPLVVLDGRDPENLKRAVLSGTFTGSIVTDRKREPLPL
jgi:uridylate kinase